MSQHESIPPSDEDVVEGTAWLILRDQQSWGELYALVPGHPTTLGRAATNRISIEDTSCSRHHCEIFRSGDRWVLRDLQSRNGTRVHEQPIQGDFPLQHGQLIRVGQQVIGFTESLPHPFPDVIASDVDLQESDTITSYSDQEPEILHRQRENPYFKPGEEWLDRERVSRELSSLYRLSMQMGQANDSRTLSNTVLDGLLERTSADIGAILLHAPGSDSLDPNDLHVMAFQSENELPYRRVSRQLSKVVMEQQEAILAKDVGQESPLTARDSLGQLQAESLICAPVRKGNTLLGLIHLYSTNLDNPLEVWELEYTLAVADQFAIALTYHQERETLSDGLEKARQESQTLREQLQIESELVGESESMNRLKENIARTAPTDATVLVRGESGVGKELVSRAIHFNSGRSQGPFVCMNCAALSETLLESELFGHEKGAFTGATARKIGKFEQAHQGTLFLDEVGEMGASLQAKFLRALEGHPFERVGGGTSVQVDVRVVAATNRDLEQAVKEQQFRADLYFRLHVVQIFIDPLRDRVEDIAILAEHFLQKFVAKSGRIVEGFTSQAMKKLTNYKWPGNVRELQNTIERAVILCRGTKVDSEDIQLTNLGVDADTDPEFTLGESSGYREVSLKDLEQEHIMATLEWTDWNKSSAARILGIERSTLDRKLKSFNVSRPKS